MSALPLTSPDSSAALPAPHSAWWRHLFVESDDAQLVCDRDGAVFEMNRRACTVLKTDIQPSNILKSFDTDIA